VNGPPVDVRLARESDRTGLAEMFARCTRRTRYQRFHGHVNVLPERYLAEALSGSPAHFALVACAGFPGGADHPSSVVALASCRTVAPDIAELGILVEDSSQRLGIGGFLLRQIIDHAERNGLTTLKASVLAEQAWLLRVLRRYGRCEAAAACEELDVTLRLSRCACWAGSCWPARSP
jgi:GNAT superfamily N-acetyltransferase